MRVYFTCWGPCLARLRHIPSFAVATGRDIYRLDPARAAALRSLEDRNYLAVCGLKEEGDNLYQVPLGKRPRSGGFAPIGNLWVKLGKITSN